MESASIDEGIASGASGAARTENRQVLRPSSFSVNFRFLILEQHRNVSNPVGYGGNKRVTPGPELLQSPKRKVTQSTVPNFKQNSGQWSGV
jgi:hypothetical protein